MRWAKFSHKPSAICRRLLNPVCVLPWPTTSTFATLGTAAPFPQNLHSRLMRGSKNQAIAEEFDVCTEEAENKVRLSVSTENKLMTSNSLTTQIMRQQQMLMQKRQKRRLY